MQQNIQSSKQSMVGRQLNPDETHPLNWHNREKTSFEEIVPPGFFHCYASKQRACPLMTESNLCCYLHNES
jgi:hypothetical protein